MGEGENFDARAPYAHSKDDQGLRRHALEDHLRATADLARRFAEVFGGGVIAWWLGLLHDVGKACCEWQERLLLVEGTGRPVGVPHKLLGARLAYERGIGRYSLAIAGHHGGLDTMEDLLDRLAMMDAKEKARQVDALAVIERTKMLPELADPQKVRLPGAWREPLVRDMAVRLLFSALCDADALDTAAHFRGEASVTVRDDADFALLRDRYENRRCAVIEGRNGSAIDGIRSEVYQACVNAAMGPRGIYRLAAPTGSGKTIATGGFAVHHAAVHEMRRVIVAVPFLTITEQNADVFRDLLDGDVLEHHSGVDFDSQKHRWGKLAAENWDAPFVVTTMVRLFESLFDRRPAAMRRLHRLAGSVIVLDEVQALPHQMLLPILNALRTLVEHFGATVLLSSATQPDFWHLPSFQDFPATDIIADASELIERTRRVRFDWRTEPSPGLIEVAEEAAERGTALVVLNTTADAKTVFGAWDGAVEEGAAWHLSTRMCGAHRRRVLATVNKRLRCGLPVLLVSTQLIEAGVDVDFPIVYRALAPADSLLQAAGRANREGNLPEGGLVVLIDPPDGGRPPSYKLLQGVTKIHFGLGKADPDSLEALQDYYRDVYDGLNLEGRDSTGQMIQRARANGDFPAVSLGPLDPITGRRDRSRAFRMIDDDGITVVIADASATADACEQVRNAIDRIRTAPRPAPDDLRFLQPYLVTIHRSALRTPGVLAQMQPVLGERGAPGSLAEWIGTYHPHTGIELDPETEAFVC